MTSGMDNEIGQFNRRDQEKEEQEREDRRREFEQGQEDEETS